MDSWKISRGEAEEAANNTRKRKQAHSRTHARVIQERLHRQNYYFFFFLIHFSKNNPEGEFCHLDVCSGRQEKGEKVFPPRKGKKNSPMFHQKKKSKINKFDTGGRRKSYRPHDQLLVI